MTETVPLREYMEAIYAESQKAIEKADVEREKAAAALRDGLAQQIQSGDAALRDHIVNQISQIREIVKAMERAADKFEDSVHQRFAQVNEFRAALDDLGKQMATRRELEAAVGTSAERYEQINKNIQELRSRLDTGPEALHQLQSRADLFAGKSQGISSSVGFAIAAATLLLGILVVAVNILTSR